VQYKNTDYNKPYLPYPASQSSECGLAWLYLALPALLCFLILPVALTLEEWLD